SQSAQSMHVEQRSNVPASRQGSRSAAGAKQSSQRGKSAASARKNPPSSRPGPPSAEPKDTQFIKWAYDKWSSLEARHQQVVLGSLLLFLTLLLLASLTVFRTAPILSGFYKFFLTFFGWSAYLLSLGLVAYALAHLIEGIRNQHFIRWSMVIGLTCVWLLLLIESRLILGPMAAGVLGEFLAGFLLGWPAAIGHVTILGLILISIVIAFRITFGQILGVGRFIMHLVSDPPRPPADRENDLSPFLGQRPQYSRYGVVASDPPVSARKAAQSARAGRRLIDEEYEDYDEETIEFEPDFDEEDPLNDINVHKQEVGLVLHGSRTPQPLDEDEHADSVRGAQQRVLPFEETVRDFPNARSSRGSMEPLAPNPRLLKQQPKSRSVKSAPMIISPWKLPDLSLLHNPDDVKLHLLGDDTAGLARTIQETLRSFRVDAEVRQEDISIGPTVIRFGIRPTGKPAMKQDDKTGKMVPVRDATGNIVYEVRTRVSRIMALQNDLALVLEAKTIRMEAPVPGRPYVGVEIPNKNSRLVTLREVLESKEYLAAKAKSKLAIALGKDVAGLVRVGDLARMPHLLIAGATGAGKCLAYDEPVFLADGRIMKAQELIGQSDYVIGLTDTRTMQQIPVLANFTENGIQAVFEITLDNGLIIRRTGEHPLWAAILDEIQQANRQATGNAERRTRASKAGWVKTRDLRVCGKDFAGHVILCPLSLSQHGTVTRNDADIVLCSALLAEGG